jgi:hypothetical protein
LTVPLTEHVSGETWEKSGTPREKKGTVGVALGVARRRSRLFLVGVAMDLAFVLLVGCHYIMEVRMEKWWNDAMAAEEDTKLSWMDFRLELKRLNCVELKFQV